MNIFTNKRRSHSSRTVTAVLILTLLISAAWPTQFLLASATSTNVQATIIETPQLEIGTTSQLTKLVPNQIIDESPALIEDTKPTTTITTGDAVSGVTIETDSNVIEIVPTPDISTHSNTISSSTSSSTLDVPEVHTIIASSTATTSTNATSSAESGHNNAIGQAVVIDTGNAIAYADILNVVNTNIIDSAGLVQFFNNVLGYSNFDIRDSFIDIFLSKTAQSTPSCTLTNCTEGDTLFQATTTADAHITNTILVTADTGNNVSVGDSSVIRTGDSYAAANVVNVANTNITDSKYLLLVFNNFADYAGNIVLPNSSFFADILKNGDSTAGVSVTNNNQATTTNEVFVEADTGGNESISNLSTITTGNSSAGGSITNLLNTNLFNTSSFNMLIRVHGDWSGNIYGLPEGIEWQETDQGIQLFSIGSNGSGTDYTGNRYSNNTATIHNNISVYALTGNNKAYGSSTIITTGDAIADATILNLANTNIVGSNWSQLIFNIYGNWNGDLTFGETDLWIGMRAYSADNPIMPDSEVELTYTVFNRGDSAAHNVVLNQQYESGALLFSDTDLRTTSVSNKLNNTSLPLGTIGAGVTKEFVRTVRINTALPSDVVSAIPLTANISSTEPDANNSDNSDTVTMYVGASHRNNSDKLSLKPTFPANVEITKKANLITANPGDIVDYTITLKNRGGQLYDAVLVDILSDETGAIVQQQTWPLDLIHNDELITINYSFVLDNRIATGTYTNTAQVVGFHGSQKPKYQRAYESVLASHILTVGGLSKQVLGISTCPPYLTSYLKAGQVNAQVEVLRLQQFLSTHTNQDLLTTGVMDMSTTEAVKIFQQTYREDILEPWGLTKPSGYVYYTTQKKINEIACNNNSDFPLNQVQKNEIATFRSQKVQPSTIASSRLETTAAETTPPIPTVVKKPITQIKTWQPLVEVPKPLYLRIYTRLQHWVSDKNSFDISLR